jgi:hypothetical protein
LRPEFNCGWTLTTAAAMSLKGSALSDAISRVPGSHHSTNPDLKYPVFSNFTVALLPSDIFSLFSGSDFLNVGFRGFKGFLDAVKADRLYVKN